MSSRTLGLKLEDDDPWDVEQSIFDILVDVLEPNSTLSLYEAALKLDALFPTNHPEQGKPRESPESFLWEFWGRIVKTAQQIVHDSPAQDQLVDLVLALKSLDNPQTLEIWGRKVQLWTDLPLLGPELTKTWNSFAPQDEPSRRRWLGLTAFVARLVKINAASVETFPLYVLRDALEGRTSHSDSSQANADLAADPEIECHVAAAYVTLSQCGQLLYECGCAQEYGALGGDGNTGGPLWMAQAGFRRRWAFWKERWAEIESCDAVDGNVRRMARETRSMMEAIESSKAGKADEAGRKYVGFANI